MDNSNKTLVIVPCVKKKIWDKDPLAKSVKAEEAYISNYFNLCKHYAKRFSDKWIIFSGKFGILEPEEIFDNNYNTKLRPSEEFKIKVKKQMESIMSKRFTHIISLCGVEYSNFLKEVLIEFGLTVNTPLDGMRIGIRQRKLKMCLVNNNNLYN